MRFAASGAAALAVAAVAGCAASDPDDRDPSATPNSAPAEPGEPGKFVGECGSVTDAEVAEKSAISGLVPVAHNGIKCRWEADGGMRYVLVTWYRGSPIDRERAVAEGIGHEVHDLEIDGHRGFSSQNTDFCEVAIDMGPDFIHWLVRYGPDAPADTCAAPTALAALTLENAE